MSLRRIPAPILLGIAALGPIALGVAAHLEHEQSEHIVIVETPPVIVPVAHAVEIPVEAPPPVEPEIVEAEPEVVEPLEIPPYGEDFLFITDIGRAYVVLALDAPAAWGKGRFQSIEGQWGTVQRKVANRKLPEHLRGWAGREVTVHSDTTSCTGTLGKPQVVAQYDGELDLLLEDPPDDLWDSDRLPKSLQRPVWKEGRRLLVAPVSVPADCGAPTWAQPIGTPAPVIYEQDTATAHSREVAVDALLSLPEMKTLAEELAADTDGDGPYPELSEQTESTAWRNPSDDVAVVTMEVSGEAFYMCGGYDEEWAVATVTDGHIDRLDRDSLAVASSVVDLENDRTPEILTTGTRFVDEAVLWSLTSEGLTSRYVLPAVPFIGCPC